MVEEIEAARREGYQRGLAVAFFWVACAATLYTAAWTMMETPPYLEAFEQMKVPMPGMTVLLLDYYEVMAVGLTLAAAFCAFITFQRKCDSRTTMLLNGALFVVALGWSALASMAIRLPWMSLLQGVGKGRP